MEQNNFRSHTHGDLGTSDHKLLAQATSVATAEDRTDSSKVFVDVCEFGLGVFAAQALTAGEHILSFSGPGCTFAESAAKGESQCYTLQIGSNEYIDLTAPGCFVNHSCNPNAGVRDLHLVAIRDIAADEEIRFDYSTTMDEDYWQMDCQCRSPRCRKIVRDFKFLPDGVQSQYIALGIVRKFIARSARNFGSRRRAS